MSPRAEARTAHVLLCLTAGALIGCAWIGTWTPVALLTVTALAVQRWAHHARRVANRPTHRRTA